MIEAREGTSSLHIPFAINRIFVRGLVELNQFISFMCVFVDRNVWSGSDMSIKTTTLTIYFAVSLYIDFLKKQKNKTTLVSLYYIILFSSCNGYSLITKIHIAHFIRS
jgi:hypothetical protein